MAECVQCGKTYYFGGVQGGYCSNECKGNKAMAGMGCGVVTLIVAFVAIAVAVGTYEGIIPWWGWGVAVAIFWVAGKMAQAKPLN